MKTLGLSICAVALIAAFAAENAAHSQAPVVPQTPVQRLEALAAKNKKLIETQQATLKKLEEMELQSQQLKFMGRRT